ncbi:M28 family peptidase [Anatilimnocola aggregata]|nr:M28 family peptidase [Anatilimnocola aggregata]
MNNPPPKLNQRVRWSTVIGIAVVVLGIVIFVWGEAIQLAWSQRAVAPFSAAKMPLQSERAYAYLKEVCAIGPRISGTPGMLKQQELLKNHFEKLGAKVSLQEFDARHPETGQRVRLANQIVQWHPEKRDRILLCCHYDTRPYPDREPDPRKVRDPFIGANDGGSGVAMLMELGNHMAGLRSKYGVDFVFFDGEELVYDDNLRRDPYFLGSEYFARDYVTNPPAHKYRWGVLVDMIGDKQLTIYREVNSMAWTDTRPLVLELWKTAAALGVKEFVNVTRHEIRDDHLALRNVAKIPTCDIIDFEYPNARGPNYWHTTQDVPENCSGESICKVGYVIFEWLKLTK